MEVSGFSVEGERECCDDLPNLSFVFSVSVVSVLNSKLNIIASCFKLKFFGGMVLLNF